MASKFWTWSRERLNCGPFSMLQPLHFSLETKFFSLDHRSLCWAGSKQYAQTCRYYLTGKMLQPKFWKHDFLTWKIVIYKRYFQSIYFIFFKWKEVQQKLAWDVIILLGAGFALADACVSSGLSLLLGEKIGILMAKIQPGLLPFSISLLISFITGKY